ncbi:MAG: diaminopimelate epimerase [Christensenellales bacterium]|jgi:diaminopimelate epimerase
MQFEKMHGLGNDFILVDARYGMPVHEDALAGFTEEICNRRTGIGADGLILVLASDTADHRMRILNSDGSEAEMCGNGIRCFARYVYEHGIETKDRFGVETLAGVMRPQLVFEDGGIAGITVDMGEPLLDRSDIPMIGPDGPVIRESIEIDYHLFDIAAMRMGVPHTMVFVPEVTDELVRTYGPPLESCSLFPQRTNVNFVQFIDHDNILIRTYERGAGPTLACGTGSCAAAVACMLRGLTGRTVNVHLALGTLVIRWDKDGRVQMTGPAETAFTGEY